MTEYLPPRYLKYLLNTLTDSIDSGDVIEYCIPFDPVLKFWYDDQRVPTLDLFKAFSEYHFNYVDYFYMRFLVGPFHIGPFCTTAGV